MSSGAGCAGTIGRNIVSTSFNMASGMIQGANSLNLSYDDQHQRLQQVNTVSGTATTATLYLNDAASGAMSQRVSAAGTTPTVWNGFTWAGAPWGGTTANSQPTFVDYITLDGQVVAQRSVQYPAATSWGQHNWGAFNWGLPPGSQWGAFNWGAANWSGAVVNWAYFTLDHLGSVAVITAQNGTVVQRLSYDAWGKQRNPNGTDAGCGAVTAPTTRGFTNQEQMPTQCLVNLNARLYDPSIGKFMAADSIVPDPYNGQSFNRYAYVTNNPLSLTDPTGNDPEDGYTSISDFRDEVSSGTYNTSGVTGITIIIAPSSSAEEYRNNAANAYQALSTMNQISQTLGNSFAYSSVLGISNSYSSLSGFSQSGQSLDISDGVESVEVGGTRSFANTTSAVFFDVQATVSPSLPDVLQNSAPPRPTPRPNPLSNPSGTNGGLQLASAAGVAAPSSIETVVVTGTRAITAVGAAVIDALPGAIIVCGLVCSTPTASGCLDTGCYGTILQNKSRGPTLHCQNVECGAPTGGVTYPVCPSCNDRLRNGGPPITLENGQKLREPIVPGEDADDEKK